MDLYEARADGREELIASGLTPTEVAEFLDWSRYTKPFGPSVRIVVRENPCSAFALRTTGTCIERVLHSPEPVPSAAEPMPSESFFG